MISFPLDTADIRLLYLVEMSAALEHRAEATEPHELKSSARRRCVD
jgi:hypothetical protein